MVRVSDITRELERFAPPIWQESYDNAGLIIGDSSQEVTGVLLSLDLTEEILKEAIDKGYNMVISHHPIIFKGLKRVTGKDSIERIVISAIKHDIAIYAAHTNLDSVPNGVNHVICEKLNIQNYRPLAPKRDSLLKIVAFIPTTHKEQVLNAMFKSGAGDIGDYSSCSFSSKGTGSFQAKEGASPFVGEIGEIHQESEQRVEVIVEHKDRGRVISALIESHPYEEVAYDIIPLSNLHPTVGSGAVGDLAEPISEIEFLQSVKEKFSCNTIKHSRLRNRLIKRVAVCGGSGSSLIGNAAAANADIFITGDITYHQFSSMEDRMIIADIGHYESELHSKEIFYNVITKKFPNFAVSTSECEVNPVNYF